MIEESRYDRAAEWPLTLAALLFLATFAWPVLDPDLSSPWHSTCDAVVA